MSQTDEERLVILLEARIKDLERNMAKGSGITEREFRKMSQSSKRATTQMEKDAIRSTTRINQAMATVGTKIGAVGKAFGAGLWGSVAGLGVAGIVGTLASVAKGVSEVGDQAKMAGVDFKSFQELKYVAEQNRVGVDALTDGLKELNIRADEFILTGKGYGEEAFKRLGFSAEELKEKLKNPSELFTEIIGKLGKLDKAAQIRIADEVFGGTGGERFVQLIDQGEQGIRDTIKAANDLGLVMDDQLIERAAEVDRRFNQIANTVGSVLKSAIVSAADSLAEFIDGFRDYQSQMNSTLGNRQAEIGARRLEIENEILKTQQSQREETEKLSSVAKDLGFENSKNAAVAGYTGQIAALNDELRRLGEEDAKITGIINQRVQPMNRSGNNTWTPPNYVPPSTGGGRSSAEKQAEREKKAVQQLIAELEEELRIVGLSDAQKRASVASRQAGAAATDEERAKIVALNEAIYQGEEARRKSEDQMLYYADLTRAGIDDLFGAIEQGKGLWEAMGDVAVNSLKRIASTVLDDVLTSIFKLNSAASGGGGGFLSSLFGGLFGGGSTGGFAALPSIGPIPSARPSFDGGGYTGSGSRSGGLDGKGGFWAMMHPQETVIDHTKGQSVSSGGKSEVLVKLSPELVGQILQQAGNQSVKLIKQSNKEARNFKSNGGNDY